MSRGAIGFLLHPEESPGIVPAAAEAAVRCGYRTWTTMVRPVEDVAEHAQGTELLVTLGGDGTFLFGARLAAPRDIPSWASTGAGSASSPTWSSSSFRRPSRRSPRAGPAPAAEHAQRAR